MSEVKQEEKTKEKKKVSKSAIVLIVGLIIIAIPVAVFCYILLSASMKTGTPILGDRFKNDLTTEITSESLSKIESSLKTISNVEAVTIDDPDTGRLIIMIDCKDTLNEEEVTAIAEKAYDKVIEVLPAKTYFTQGDNARNYDLTIYVYTTSTATAGRTLITVTYNSQMDLPSYENNSKAKNEEIAKELRGENEPSSTEEPEGEDNAEAGE